MKKILGISGLLIVICLFTAISSDRFLLMGNVDFSSLFIDLSGQGHATLAAAKEAGAPTINYGLFINTVLDFIIVAFAIFMVVKAMNRLKKKEPAPAPAAPTTKECPHCLSSIPIKATRCAHCTADLKAA